MTRQGAMREVRFYTTRKLAGGMVLMSLVFFSQAALGQDASEICETALSRADSSYVVGRFDESISLLEYCLDQDLMPAEEEIDAYLLIAKAHQRQDRDRQARVAIRTVLERDPHHQLDPIRETPAFRRLFEEMRVEMGLHTPDVAADTGDVRTDADRERSRPAWRRWLFAGGGVVVAGSVAAILLGGGGNGGGGPSDTWPQPPGRPGQ